MTIHFHSKHFAQCKQLSLEEYFIVLAHEQRANIPLVELMELVNLTERSVCRKRANLCSEGYLEKSGNSYLVTDKLYK